MNITSSETSSARCSNIGRTLCTSLFVPASTPPALVGKLNAEVNRALKDRSVRDLLEKAGMQVLGSTPEELRQMLASDFVCWGGVVKAARVQID